MKKIICAALAAVMLTGCAASGNSENTPTKGENSSSSGGTGSFVVSTDTSTSTDTSVSSISSTSSTLSSAPFSSSSSSSDSASIIVAFPENFKLGDYVSGFDDVQPMGYTVTPLADNTCGQAVIDKAIEAYESSVYIKEAFETAYERFHVENGELIPNVDIDAEHITDYLSIWGYGLSVNDNDEIDIETKAISGVTAKFDGVNNESIVILISFMPSSFFEWSGGMAYYPVVYINGVGEASFIGTLSRQTLYSIDMIEYEDGTIHLMVSSGHTDGTSRCYIVSFRDGKLNCELLLHYVLCGDGIFYSCPYRSLRSPFFWNGEEYCGISGVKPDRELAEIICGNKSVLESVPDAQKEYDNGTLFIVGGKYITFAGRDVTFTVSDRGFEENDSMIYYSKSCFFDRVEIGENTGQYDMGEETELPLYNIVLD